MRLNLKRVGISKINIDGSKVLKVVVPVISLVGMLLSNKLEDTNREELKNELKKELLDEISNQ